MKLLLGLLLGGAVGALAMRRLRPSAPALGGPAPAPGAVAEAGPRRVAVDVSSFAE